MTLGPSTMNPAQGKHRAPNRSVAEGRPCKLGAHAGPDADGDLPDEAACPEPLEYLADDLR